MLLAIENFHYLRLKHGVMEAGYVEHQKSVISASEQVAEDESLSISMTATRDASGNLLIGNIFILKLIYDTFSCLMLAVLPKMF